MDEEEEESKRGRKINNKVNKCQRGFRKGRGTMDPVLCLEHEIRRAQVNTELVVTVFFDVEKAYGMMWKDKRPFVWKKYPG